MTETDKKIAQTIADNLHAEFVHYKDKNNNGTETCPCCKRKYPFVTIKWLASVTGISKPTLDHYFQGNRIPKISQLIKISEALDCTLQDLLYNV
jgi:predicted DNA-binding transcriptional regulator AlpA